MEDAQTQQPKKPKRTLMLKIRVTPEERAEIYGRVPDGSDFADWIRRLAMEKPLRRRADIEKTRRSQCDFNPQLADLKNHYSWALSNFNQISKNLNESAKVNKVSPVEVAKAYTELFRIAEHLNDMKRRLDSYDR